MNDINKSLVALGLNKKEIERVLIIYNRAVELGFPYPLYYSFLKLKT
jgi:hypothetical protein